ncbi:alpha/beta hydrolase [Streptomyces sp. NPDC048290]|uniref:alpha/beta hydrolase n=1 Tax=Streptomyces sp. NPDC048290 TaxID=3155811 RepID=UPI0034294F1C
MRTRRHLRFLATTIALAGLTLAGCQADDPKDAATGTNAGADAVPVELKAFHGQKLRWRACENIVFECATLQAPLDYAEPNGPRIDLAVSRMKASTSGRSLGSLLLNPGGPGASAVDYLHAVGLEYPARIIARYDLAAIDPRGVGGSRPVACAKDVQDMGEFDETPDDTGEQTAYAEALKRAVRGCDRSTDPVLAHMSTADSARDMDLFRSALGDRTLSFIGTSYGTFLGATYAELFPRRTGRLVLDAAMDPSRSPRELLDDQAEAYETAFRSFARDCVRLPDCPLGTASADAAAQRMKGLFDAFDEQPVPAGGGEVLSEASARTGVRAALYSKAAWPTLRTALTGALAGDGAALLAMARQYVDMDGDGSNSEELSAHFGVRCLDGPPAFRSPEEVAEALPALEATHPLFGADVAWSGLVCAYWPVEATGAAHRIEAKGAAPILVLGTTRDPATPYRWAQSLAGQLSTGRLLTRDGDGHGAYDDGSDCVDTAVDAFLLRGTLPENGRRCA